MMFRQLPTSVHRTKICPVFVLAGLLLLFVSFSPAAAQTMHPASRAVRTEVTFPPIATLTATFNLDLVDMYAEFYPEQQEAEFKTVVYLEKVGTYPVILRCEGNFKHLSVSADQLNVAFAYQAPHFWLYNLTPGPHRVKFTYRARHDGFVPANSTIAPHMLSMPGTVFWYPRNPYPDQHQIILNAVMPEGYLIQATASMTRDLPHNFRRLRTWLRTTPATDGLSLSR